MSLLEWTKPPNSLLLVLTVLTLVSVSCLGWLGWRLLEQDQIVARQSERERLEKSVDRIAELSRGRLAQAAELLTRWTEDTPIDAKLDDGILVLFDGNSLNAFPPNRLLYRPFRSRAPEAPSATFARGEAIEFAGLQPAEAADRYHDFASSPNPAIRAGAWMRIGRVMRVLKRPDEAIAAYQRMAEIQGVDVAGSPADLIALHALCELRGRQADADRLFRGLMEGRWQLDEGQFEFYYSEASRFAHRTDPEIVQSTALTKAAAFVWSAFNPAPSNRGQKTVWVNGDPFLFIWRVNGTHTAVLILNPAVMLEQISRSEDVVCAAVDADGRLVAGRRDRDRPSVVRTAADTETPWTLYVAPGKHEDGTAGRAFLRAALVVMVAFLMFGTYFMARAIRREAQVARLQSDFVSAVSHEFRSPLTSILQLSEMLLWGRVPDETRRQLYHEMLVKETRRLQRLVEALLNFGRMERGARYQVQELDVGEIARQAVDAFSAQVADSGRKIELIGEAGCRITADPEAIAVALRNLIDNALKYSPNQPTVWVEWAREDRYVVIRVRDQGAGIQPAETQMIFEKFVRGSAAAAGNISGTGVGLAVVRQIVLAHGGDIRVTSQVGKDSTFTMLLPAAKT